MRQLFAALKELTSSDAAAAAMEPELQVGIDRATEFQDLHRRGASNDKLSAGLGRLVASCKNCHIQRRDRR